MSLWNVSVNMSMQTQAQTEWCWAATTVSAATYLNSADAGTQCELVGACLSQQCCADGSTAACNVPWYLGKALAHTGNLDVGPIVPPAFADIVTILASGLPLGARIGWQGGGGHFVAIVGADSVNVRLNILDPRGTTEDFSDADFRQAYRNIGTWTHAYKMKRNQIAAEASGGGPAVGVPVPVSSQLSNIVGDDPYGRKLESMQRLLQHPMRRPFPHLGPSALKAYDVYFIGLNDAAGESPLKAARLSGRRTIVQGVDGLTMAEVTVNPDGTEREPHLSTGHPVDSIAAILQQSADAIGQPETVTRYLSVSALSLRALWLISKDGSNTIIPITPAPPPLTAGRRYSGAAFEQVLRPLAATRITIDVGLEEP